MAPNFPKKSEVGTWSWPCFDPGFIRFSMEDTPMARNVANEVLNHGKSDLVGYVRWMMPKSNGKYWQIWKLSTLWYLQDSGSNCHYSRPAVPTTAKLPKCPQDRWQKKHWAVDLCILWGGNEAVGVSIHVFGTPISVQSHVQLLQATSCAWTSFAGLTPNWSVHQPSPSHVFHELSYIQMIDTLRCNVILRPPEIRSCEWLESQNHPGPEWILLRCGSQTQVSKMNILREVPLQKCRNVPEKKSYERSPTQSKVPQKISWIRFFKRKPFVGSSIRKSAREVLYKTSEGSSPKFPKKNWRKSTN